MIPVLQWDGEPISVPGLYANIPLDAYHRQLTVGPSISSSGLRDIFHRSPRAYFRNSYLNPTRAPQKVSEAFIFGRGAHHLLLGEENFRHIFAVRPLMYPSKGYDEDLFWRPVDPELDWNRGHPWNANATWCKAWLSVAGYFGYTILTQGDIRMIRAMAEALAAESLVQQGILNGLVEHSFVWKDEATGIWLKWRPDVLPTDSLNFSDFKTTTSVDDEDIERTIGKFGYNMQGALGALACNTVLGREMEDFSLVFVEKEEFLPCVRTKTIRASDIALGLKQIDVSLRTFAKCVETGRWLGPGGDQHDNEYSGLHDRQAERINRKIDEMERLLES